jgi:hypothetical protein
MTGPTSDPHPSELRSGVLRNRVTYGTVRIWIEIQFYAVMNKRAATEEIQEHADKLRCNLLLLVV